MDSQFPPPEDALPQQSRSSWGRNLLDQPFSVLWRAGLMKLPRLAPLQSLKFTNPQGPHPFVLNLPSHGAHKVPVHVFVPPDLNLGDLARRAGSDGTKPWEISLPVVIDLHGGGFFIGSCLEQAPFCSKLTRELNAVSITVDYAMGPVEKFPTANEDSDDVIAAILNPKLPAYALLRAAIKDRIISDWKESRRKSIRVEASGANRGKYGGTDKEKKEKERKKEQSDKQLEIIVPRQLSNFTFDFDQSKIAVSGFSSGGNLALNTAINVPASAPTESPSYGPKLSKAWPAAFPDDFQYKIPLLLFYPSLDARQLPSERTKPPDMPIPNSFWEQTNDILMPTYLPRHLASHHRASPGLADIEKDLHPQARMLLILPRLDNLAHQAEIWVERVKASSRAKDLRVERFATMKHGWTQIPWLQKEEEKWRDVAFNDAVRFVRQVWDSSFRDDVSRESVDYPVKAQEHEVQW